MITKETLIQFQAQLSARKMPKKEISTKVQLSARKMPKKNHLHSFWPYAFQTKKKLARRVLRSHRKTFWSIRMHEKIKELLGRY